MGVLLAGLALACLGTVVDSRLRVSAFTSPLATTAAWLLLAFGFLVRVWGTFH